ncbi:MAG: glycosyltransferase [Oceanidesulfovibrio sp.]
MTRNASGLPPSPLVVCDIVQSYSPISGGVKRYLQDKSKYMAAHRELRHVLVIPGDEDDFYIDRNTTVYVIDSPSFVLTKSYRLLVNRSRILKIIASEQPDVIEVDNAYIPAWITLEAHELFSVPLVGFYHSDYPRALGMELGRVVRSDTVDMVATKAIEYYLAELYNRMTCTVTATRHFERQLKEMGVARVERIPLCTDVDVFRPMDSRQAVLRELGLSEKTYLILFVGRLAEMKNLPETFAMLDVLGEDDRDIHLLVVGDGEERDLVIEETTKRSNATWMQYVHDSKRLAALYSAADLFINAGTHETFGLVSLEAQACGTRVLGVRGGGMDETLEGEEPAVIAESESPEDLAEAVRRIRSIEEGEEAAVLRRERIIRYFSIGATFDALTDLYRRLVHEKTRANSSSLE